MKGSRRSLATTGTATHHAASLHSDCSVLRADEKAPLSVMPKRTTLETEKLSDLVGQGRGEVEEKAMNGDLGVAEAPTATAGASTGQIFRETCYMSI